MVDFFDLQDEESNIHQRTKGANMHRPLKLLSFLILMASLTALQLGGVGGCSGGSTSSGGGASLGVATTLTGTVFAPNGTDPISGATVFIPGSATTRGLAGGITKKTVTADCTGKGGTITCADAGETACASTCSCADGSYSFDVSTCATSSTTVKFTKGDFTGSATLDCSSTTCTANISGSTTSGSTARIAVVTGAFDEIENVLAKLGYGTVITDSSVGTVGTLQLGTETFAIYKCGGGRDSELTALDPAGTTYKPCEQLFGSLTEMQKYDTIFIDCGASEDTAELQGLTLGMSSQEAHTLYHQSKFFKSVSSNVTSRLSSFVNAGGTLYVTDLAYDYVEQTFPSFMDFQFGGDSDSSTAETAGAAEQGTPDIVSNATVNNTVMNSWLSGRSSNTVDSSTSPNGGACDTTANGNSSSLLDATAGTIRIGDFLSSWGVMKEVYSGDTDTFVWIQGPVNFTGGTTNEVHPLTASRIVGSGCVLYSSYHTSHSCPTSGFWPQERVLQYLVFETSGACTP